jgi:hypothetical protein
MNEVDEGWESDRTLLLNGPFLVLLFQRRWYDGMVWGERRNDPDEEALNGGGRS